MQLRLTWLVLVLFAVGIMSIGIVGCGTDEEETPETPTESSSAGSGAAEEPIVASKDPIDFEAEKQAIQEVFTTFYQGFNDQDLKVVQETFDTSAIKFGVIFAGDEPVPVASGWFNVKTVITGLWDNHTTANNKWGSTPNLAKFWIRYKGSSLEASALGYNAYKTPPGETHLYLVKKKGEWLIQQIDGVSNRNVAKFGLDNTAKPRIEKFFARSSDDEEDLAP